MQVLIVGILLLTALLLRLWLDAEDGTVTMPQLFLYSILTWVGVVCLIVGGWQAIGL